jgi:hypothetical protein
MLNMQNQIQFGLEIGAARSTFSWREDLRRVVELKPSTTEPHKVINIFIIVKQQSQR